MIWLAALLAGLLAPAGTTLAVTPDATAATARSPDITALPGTGIIGLRTAQLDAQYWIGRQPRPNAVLLDSAAIAARNTRMQHEDPALHDLDALPATLAGTQVRGWIEARSQRPAQPLFDADGKQGTPRQLDRLMASLHLKDIPDAQVTRFGLVTRRAPLRTFPSAVRVFNAPGDSDIDRFQETALFPGTPVAIAHASRDRAWLFVVAPTYAGWVLADAVAQGDRDTVLGYARRTPFRVVTDATARTVHSPAQPQLSALLLDMGVRLPWRRDWPASQPVGGQLAAGGHVVELPTRNDDGSLALMPALLPRSVGSAAAYLPMTQANILRQAFAFLGERYGWGHDYDARDCSGFVAEVYRSMGVLLPRNTGDQAASALLTHLPLADAGSAARAAQLKALRVGDLVYVPGHVMLVVGQEAGTPYVIHDVAALRWRDGDGKLVRAATNGVVVSPLLPLYLDADTPMVDRITALVRIAAPKVAG